MIRTTLLTLAIIAGSLAAVFGLEYFDLITTKFFAPRHEAIRRETFEQSKAYNQGTIQEIENLYLEYGKASEEHKKAIGSIVLHRLADFDKSKLSPELQQFVSKLKNNY
jgi:hypothetical protein